MKTVIIDASLSHDSTCFNGGNQGLVITFRLISTGVGKIGVATARRLLAKSFARFPAF